MASAMSKRETAKKIFLCGLDAVNPVVLTKEQISLDNNTLSIGSIKIATGEINNLYITGFGKAAAAMAAGCEERILPLITSGHVITRYGHSLPLKKITVREAGHPFPDESGVIAAAEVMAIADKAGSNDVVLCLISGGSSALLADLPEGCSLDDLIALNHCLLASGADIHEVNTVRRHLATLKGGRLAQRVYPAKLISLILPDIPGDITDNTGAIVGSGPTWPDTTTPGDALSVIHKYKLEGKIPPPMLKILTDRTAARLSDVPDEIHPAFTGAFNIIIGTNRIALEAAATSAASSGYRPVIVTGRLQGLVPEAAAGIMETVARTRAEHPDDRVCLLYGGETSMVLPGRHGLGGRNQHLALLAATMLENSPDITFLAAGTDGSDGNTDAAGAVVDDQTTASAAALGIRPGDFIRAYDSNTFFRKAGGIIKTGVTYTNVMDMIIVLIN